jgi:hypothetical protein
MNRKRYHALFEVYKTTDPRTGKTRQQATYTGPCYHIEELGTNRVQWCARLAPGVIVFLGILSCYLSTDLPSTRYFLVLPFALMMLLPFVFWLQAVWRILTLPAKFTQMQHDAAFLACTRNAYALIALCALFAAGEAILLATGGAGERWRAEAAFSGAMLAAGAAAWLTVRQAKKLNKLVTQVS